VFSYNRIESIQMKYDCHNTFNGKYCLMIVILLLTRTPISHPVHMYLFYPYPIIVHSFHPPHISRIHLPHSGQSQLSKKYTIIIVYWPQKRNRPTSPDDNDDSRYADCCVWYCGCIWIPLVELTLFFKPPRKISSLRGSRHGTRGSFWKSNGGASGW